jgi:hypothetical protein
VSEREYLLLLHGGSVWALPRASVRTLQRDGRNVRVTSLGGELHVGEALGIARGLAVRRPGALLERLWPERCVGLAVHGGKPVVVIDPEVPPAALRGEGAAAHD